MRCGTRARRLPGRAPDRIEWLPEYRNQDIVRDVFDRVDAIVVPSVWVENSPLVIHEALAAGVPVISADVGGMAEYVRHEVNGLLFTHRDPAALAKQMQRLVDEPEFARRLGSGGYVQDPKGRVPDIDSHVRAVEGIYEQALGRRDTARVEPLAGPFRITFDTNPDTCNLQCVMCEEHSPHSQEQDKRRLLGKPRRVMPIESSSARWSRRPRARACARSSRPRWGSPSSTSTSRRSSRSAGSTA